MNVSTISPKPGSRITAVITAMPEEAAALRAALRDVREVPGQHGQNARDALHQPGRIEHLGRHSHGPRTLVRGRLGSTALVLAVSGDGELNAREHAAHLFAVLHGEIERLLILGVAGALSPALHVGDLIVADEVRAEAGGKALYGDHQWAERAEQLARAKHIAGRASVQRGVALSARCIADTAHEKQRLLSLCNAAGKPCSVDLESFAYASAAETHCVPWLVLRAISDTADESLPEVLNRSRDAGGAVLRSRVLRSLLTDPRPLPKLLRLQRRVSRASVLLAGATAAVVSHPLPPAADEPTSEVPNCTRSAYRSRSRKGQAEC